MARKVGEIIERDVTSGVSFGENGTVSQRSIIDHHQISDALASPRRKLNVKLYSIREVSRGFQKISL